VTIFESLKKLTLLQSLTLCFSFVRKITDIKILSLSEVLKKIVTLQNVHLDFAECENLSFNSVYIISDALKCLPVIKNIVLEFHDFSKDEEMESSDGSESNYSSDSEQVSEFESSRDRAKMIEAISKYSDLPQKFCPAAIYAKKELKKISTVQSVEIRFVKFYWGRSFCSKSWFEIDEKGV